MFIGELEKRSGVSARAIRLYESLGLLNVKRQGRYRIFSAEHLEFVQLIKQAQRLGVSLAELQSLSAGENDLNWAALNDLLVVKRRELQRQQRLLAQQLEQIDHYQQIIADCVAQGRGAGIDRCID
ncbi:transcriptional regulator [Bacterioplanes sanyensis]|uniref:Transcriptional regulator n=1 Tax=Bacterioplanes sanyensis TaxID=1249553 RepID=A0A222FMV0_9GAMM|nr:MerR family transcriptional regulator [Bacterioplanes sanyensis]ASP40357.1 transcriptional regulator [Bacterioplanes sanyensis]